MTRAERRRHLARETLGLEAIMATGYGKSAIYQLAGLLIDGPTLGPFAVGSRVAHPKWGEADGPALRGPKSGPIV